MYIKFLPNEYVIRYKKGKKIDAGRGLSFHYFDKSTSVAVIPVSVTDVDFIFEETTEDFQNVTVQGQLAYRITDCERIAEMLNFSVDLKTKRYYEEPLKKLSKRFLNIADVLIKNRVSKVRLTRAIQAEQVFAGEIFEELKSNEEVRLLGAEITGFSILKITTNNETHRALEAHTREEILKGSDDALYERRNASIEQERKVKENELNTEISVEEKKKQIRETEIATKRMMLEKENELERIRINAQTEQAKLETAAEAEREKMKIDTSIEIERKRKELAEMRLENAKKDADAEAYRIRAVMEAYSHLSPEVLVALATLNMEPEQMIAGAFEKLAVNSDKIGTLNITPDLLESLTVNK